MNLPNDEWEETTDNRNKEYYITEERLFALKEFAPELWSKLYALTQHQRGVILNYITNANQVDCFKQFNKINLGKSKVDTSKIMKLKEMLETDK